MTHGIISSISATTSMTTDTSQTVSGDKSFTGTITVVTQESTDNSTKAASTAFVKTAVNNVDALPTQTGNSGKFLTTNGTVASWTNISQVPAQTGNSGKFLTTNGSSASWATVDLSGKQDTITGAATTVTSNDLTASRAIVSNANGKLDVSATTSTEIGYLSGVTSSIQTQLNGKASTASTLSGYGITDAYTKSEINSKLASVYKYKGTVADYEHLPNSDLTEGDVYNITSTGDNYAWVAAHDEVDGFWDKLAGTVDLSGYRTSSAQDLIDNGKAPLASPSLTGTPTAPTATAGTNTTQIATTAFVKTAADSVLPTQTNNSGKVLTTNGTSPSWSTPVSVTLRNWNAPDQE